MYVELPMIETSTPDQRLEALRNAKELLAGSPVVKSGGPFSGSNTEPQDLVSPTEMIRMAEYITTGHDYRDTHPEGKRRPVIKQVTNVTVMAPQGVDTEDLEHFLQHVENGDFTEFIRNVRDADAAEDKAEGKEDEDPRPSFE